MSVPVVLYFVVYSFLIFKSVFLSYIIPILFV